MIDGAAPATYEALEEWAASLGYRCEAGDCPGSGRNRRLVINGTVPVEFSPGGRVIAVEWADGRRGYLDQPLPLSGLTGLVSGLLAVIPEAATPTEEGESGDA